jgi:hypothetical protein
MTSETTTHHANGHHEDQPKGAIGPLGPEAQAKKDEETKTMLAERRKPLWTILDEATGYEQSLKDERAVAEASTSKAIKAIIDETKKMAFLRNGVKVQFSKRKGREVYYIKGGNEELESVDD